ncbi:ribosome maturation factor RimM [Suttonella sp. R2A3]|uniref:ribosome maturation factor RimM n=1 Tax=Suttonella sp. R2A3 TaxID=2908648 RepID=UPI001EEBD7F3|nr:ribosome maturation factor RimM [Suttonella sp. R2A3]UJF25204.1 ribosome maturation factor RimM [Suttonella sp. R2A3]
MNTPPNLIVLGRIVGVHGVRGWVKVYSDCRPREAIFSYANLYAQRGNQPPTTLKLECGKMQGKGLIAKFSECNDRDSAYALHGLTLLVDRADLPTTADNEYYWADLKGLEVVNLDNQPLGTVADLFETGANDVMVVKNAHNKEQLIPFVQPDYVREIDFSSSRIIVDWSDDWLSD